jgi:hypothetical protein
MKPDGLSLCYRVAGWRPSRWVLPVVRKVQPIRIIGFFVVHATKSQREVPEARRDTPVSQRDRWQHAQAELAG